MTSFTEFERLLETALAERTPERLAQALDRGTWIYGAGQYGDKIGRLMQGRGYRIEGFIDRRAGPDFPEFLGAPVVHPDVFTDEMARGRTCISCVVNSRPAARAVAPWVEARPFADFLRGADLPDALGEEAETFWLSARRGLADNLDRLRAVAARLADQTSIDAYVGALNFRVTGDADWLPVVGEENQYIPPDLPGFDRPITFVDGGAYDGDSHAALTAHGVRIGRYLGFEPDAGNFRMLEDYMAAHGVDGDIFTYGLSDRAHEVSFSDGQGVCSHVSDGPGTTTIRCVALDELLPDLKPDYIKLDIEGSELAALNGMERALAAHRPRLAVCLYHKPQDIWEIPEWLAGRCERFHVRQHGEFGFDTVAYVLERDWR